MAKYMIQFIGASGTKTEYITLSGISTVDEAMKRPDMIKLKREAIARGLGFQIKRMEVE